VNREVIDKLREEHRLQMVKEHYEKEHQKSIRENSLSPMKTAPSSPRPLHMDDESKSLD
jgi:hypothetical protein